MPIVINDQPIMAAAAAANIGGLGQFRERQEDVALKVAQMQQQAAMQQNEIASKQASQMFAAQQDTAQQAQQRAMQLFMLRQQQGFAGQQQQNQFEQQSELQKQSQAGQEAYQNRQAENQAAYLEKSNALRQSNLDAARNTAQGNTVGAMPFANPSPEHGQFLERRSQAEQQYDYSDLQKAKLKEIERDWATLPDKLASGELDAKQAQAYRDSLEQRERGLMPTRKKMTPAEEFAAMSVPIPGPDGKPTGSFAVKKPDGSWQKFDPPKTIPGTRPSGSTDMQKQLGEIWKEAYSLREDETVQVTKDGVTKDVVQPRKQTESERVRRANQARAEAARAMDSTEGTEPAFGEDNTRYDSGAAATETIDPLAPEKEYPQSSGGVSLDELDAATAQGRPQGRPGITADAAIRKLQEEVRRLSKGSELPPIKARDGGVIKPQGMVGDIPVLPPQDAARLPPGSKFYGADGKLREVK